MTRTAVGIVILISVALSCYLLFGGPSRTPAVEGNAGTASKPSGVQAGATEIAPPSGNSPVETQPHRQVAAHVGEIAVSVSHEKPAAERLNDFKDLVTVPINPIPAPEHYSLKLNPKAGQSYRYVSVTSTRLGSDPDQGPSLYLVSDRKLVTRLNDQGEVVMVLEQKSPWGFVPGSEKPTVIPVPASKHELLVRDGDLYELRKGDSGPQLRKMQRHVGDIQELVFDSPEQGTPEVSKPWTTNSTSPFPSTVTHKLEGFADVGGVKTAKIVSESETTVTSGFFQKLKTDALQEVNARDPGRTNTDTPSMGTKSLTYVDIETGLVVRTETEIIAQVGASQSKTVSIGQRIPIDH